MAEQFGAGLLIALFCAQHPVERRAGAACSPILGFDLTDLVTHEPVQRHDALRLGHVVRGQLGRLGRDSRLFGIVGVHTGCNAGYQRCR